VVGSSTSHTIDSVVSAKNGSMQAVAGIRHQAHVGLVDRLPAGDRGAVEHAAFGEGVLFDHRLVEGHVLPLAARVGEAEVDVFHVVVLHHLQDIFSRRHGYPFF
jgi:hypothetical protein